MRILTRFLRDPLLHFLAVGGLLFVAFHAVRGPAPKIADSDTIVVDHGKLLNFMQYQSAAFQPAYFEKQFNQLSRSQLEQLIRKYVREEALYREAGKLGLLQGDYVIRRRMVEKMRYLIDDTASETFHPTDAQLRDYFNRHKSNYEVAPSLTFTHVFVDSEKRPKTAESVAEKLKTELQSKRASFDDAPSYGDRFPYQQNYVKMTPDFVQNQLGAGFVDALMKLTPSDHLWQGPIKSQFGYHIVMLTQHKPAHLPQLSQIRDQVKEDMLRDRVAAYQKKAIDDLVKTFKVKLNGISVPPKDDGRHVADAAR